MASWCGVGVIGSVGEKVGVVVVVVVGEVSRASEVERDMATDVEADGGVVVVVVVVVFAREMLSVGTGLRLVWNDCKRSCQKDRRLLRSPSTPIFADVGATASTVEEAHI